MRILICLLFATLITTTSIQAQKVDYDKKTTVVSIDGEAFFKMERKGAKDFFFTIRNLEGEKLFLVNYRYNESDYTNGWFEFVFLASEQKVTVKNQSNFSRKMLAKYIYRNELIKDGALDKKAVKEFILVKEFEPTKEIRITTD